MPLHSPLLRALFELASKKSLSTWEAGLRDSCPEWLHLVPVLSPAPRLVSVVSWQITSTFPPMTSWGGGRCGWLGREKGKRAWTQRPWTEGERHWSFCILHDLINKNSKCNNAQTPGTQGRLGAGGLVMRAQREKGVILCIFAWTSQMEKQTKDSFPIHI